ncbi:MAG: IS200/IS605 family transposase [Abditibacteriaceae bacterium]
MPQSLCAVYIHLIFSTKDRRSLLADSFRSDLHAYLGGVLKERKSIPLSINSMPDHIHLLFTLPRTITLAKLVEEIKTSSSKWIKKQGESVALFQWQAGYGVFSISTNQIKTMRRYIENQQLHHQTINFQDEFLWLLQKHGVAYDPKYVWD